MNNTTPIIIVDDDIEDQAMLQEYFKEMNLENVVRYFENGKKVIKFLEGIEEASLLPKLLVLDLNMPILNGTQTLLQIKRNANLKDIPVVIFTTSENENEKRKCLSYGAVDYFVKPMTYDEGHKIVTKFATYIQ